MADEQATGEREQRPRHTSSIEDRRPRAAPPSAPKRDWKQLIRGEWSLLVLAMVLTLIIYSLVWGEIVKERAISNVRVTPILPDPATDAQVQGEVDLVLRASRREHEEAERELRRDGGLKLRIDEFRSPQVDERSFDAGRDEYVYPFSPRLLLHAVPMPPGRVYRVQEQQVKVAPPRFRQDISARGLVADVTVNPPVVTLRGPAGGMPEDRVIQPDPLTVPQELLDDDERDPDLERPRQMPLEFKEWLYGTENDDRLRVQIPPVNATVLFRRVAEAEIKNSLYVLIDHSTYDLEIPNEDELQVFTGAGLPLETPKSFVGRLVATERTIEDLENNLDKWAWGLRLENPANLPAEDEARMTAQFVFIAIGEEFQDRGIRFAPTETQRLPSVLVRKLPAPPRDG